MPVGRGHFQMSCSVSESVTMGARQGGDMWSALRGDSRDELQWYNKGRSLALDVARGLHFLHEHKACPFLNYSLS